MSGGYMGKIAKISLTAGTVSTINTSDYEEWCGGHGIGSAIFWDLAVEPGTWDLMDGFDQANVVTIMTSPLCGTSAVAAGGRTEIQGVGVHTYLAENPDTGMFTRSNHGGRFSAELKYAGWDGLVILGKAASPVWINIVNGDIEIRDATSEGDNLWGLDTYQTQEEIWRLAAGDSRYGVWRAAGEGFTTQKPAVEAIGPAGENMINYAAIVHDSGNGAGVGGFGGVWGSKNLKAIAVIGTGGVPIDDPQEMVDTRQWHIDNFTYDVDDPYRQNPTSAPMDRPGYASSWGMGTGTRYVGCKSCLSACRKRYKSGLMSESQCMDSWFSGRTTDERQRGCDLAQRLGISTFEISQTRGYANVLKSRGVLTDADLPSDNRSLGYAHDLCYKTAYKTGDVGEGMALGRVRWSAKLGTLEEDLTDGTIQCPSLGMKTHHYFPGNEWSWKQIFGSRDVNEHDLQFQWRIIQKFCVPYRETNYVSPEYITNMLAEKCIPTVGESSPFNWDHGHGATGIYSKGRATATAFYCHSTRFFKQSLLFCDFHWPMFFTANRADFVGPSGADNEIEIKYFNAVTGNNFTWADGMKVGRRIWNLDRAIWVLQGRNATNDKFAPYMYTDIGRVSGIYMFPVYMDGKWQWWSRSEMTEHKPVFDLAGVEEFKAHFYELEGWNDNGVPTRATLESLDLGFVADRLEAAGKL